MVSVPSQYTKHFKGINLNFIFKILLELFELFFGACNNYYFLKTKVSSTMKLEYFGYMEPEVVAEIITEVQYCRKLEPVTFKKKKLIKFCLVLHLE